MSQSSGFELITERLGPLPIVNRFLDKLRVEQLLDRFVPTRDRRCRLDHAKALGVLLRSVIVEREPIYRQQETVSTFAPGAFGLEEDDLDHLGDDAIGRALDRLFDADRASLITNVVVAARRRFGVKLEELHNDSTTIRFTGQYRKARGRSIRGKRAPFITYGHSKDHRPDLKQLLFVLTSSRDGGIPIQFRCEAGNTNDSTTHIETWEVLRETAGRVDFLYVADSKLCTAENMQYIDRKGGRFVTVIPRSRLEDEEFRRWIQTHDPAWERVVDRPNPRRKHGPRDRWSVFRYPIPSREAWPVVWVHSSLLALRHQAKRRERLAKATEELEELAESLAKKRARRRTRVEVQQKIDEIVGRLRVARYLNARVTVEQEHSFRQLKSGRPGPETRYRRVTRTQLRISWDLDEGAIAYDHKSDGMYPLLTNDTSLTPAQVLEAHKGQPTIEKRFEQLKSVHEIAPVLLKNEARVEAFFVIYFLALLVQTLVERSIRQSMAKEQIEGLPLYPEARCTRRPTTQQILRLFSLAEFHLLYRGDRLVEVFEPDLTERQRQVLRLLGVPRTAYRYRY